MRSSRAHHVLPLLVLLLAAAGCAVGSSAAPVGREYPPYDKNHRVDVYVNPGSEAQLLEGFGLTFPPAQMPTTAVLVGRIDTEARDKTWKTVASETRRRARRLGADAVVINRYDRRTGRDKSNWSDHEYRSLAATAYRYTTPRAAPGYDPRDFDRDLPQE